MSAVNINKSNFLSEVIHSDKPVLMDFWAPWCGPCRMVGPYIDQIAEAYAGKAAVCKVNVDECPEIAARYGVSTIPTVMVFHQGKLVERAVGARPKKAFEQMLDQYLA